MGVEPDSHSDVSLCGVKELQEDALGCGCFENRYNNAM